MKESKGLMLGLLAVVMIALAIGFTVVSSAMAEQKGPVILGALVPQTGICATQGTKEAMGIEIAVEQINEMGGVLGRPLKVIIEDTESRPKAAMEGVHKLVDVDKVPFIIGCHMSPNTIPTGTYSGSRGVIQVSLSSTAPDVRHVGPRHFSICGLDDIMGKYCAQFAMEDSGKKKWSIMVPNNQYGVGLAKEMQKEIERQAGKVVSLVKYEVGHPDYRGELQRLFASRPEGVVAVSWSEMARIQHKQAFEMGLTETVKGAWYVPYPWDVIGEAIPETVEGIKGLDYGFGTPRTAQFFERFERRNPGVEVVSDAIRAYDACWVAALAMGISGSAEPDNILKVLPFVFSMYKGASSSDLEVDEDGMQRTQVYFAWIARNGKLVRYTDEVIGAR